MRQRLIRKDKVVQKVKKKPDIEEEKPSQVEEDYDRDLPYVNDIELENKLKESLRKWILFKSPSRLLWYRVNDIAKLSNLYTLVVCKHTIVCKPQDLSRTFKYRHLLAGFYRSDINDLNYFVLGVPQRMRPTENHLKKFVFGYLRKTLSLVI